MKKTFRITLTIPLFALLFSYASAHVTVRPNKVGIGSFQVFTVGVPVEKSMPTIGLKLLIPEGLDYVSPSVKPGWKINIKKNSSDKVIEIDWTEGNIPVGQRDDFTFSAKVSTIATALTWKAYQTYGDQSVVAWDLDSQSQPKKASGEPDFSKSGPYSKTDVIDDLTDAGSSKDFNTSDWLSLAALLVALSSFYVASKKK